MRELPGDSALFQTKFGKADLTNEALQMSGAEIEGLLIRAKRRALIEGREEVLQADLESELGSYLPPQYGEEIDLQILAALAECTDKRFLTPEYREMDRGEVARKLAALKQRWD